MINDDLFPYYLKYEKKEPALGKQFQKYSKIIRELPENWQELAMFQITTHKIFRKGGRLGPYLRHPDFQYLTKSDRDFLHHHLRHPWRFSFSYVKEFIDDEILLMYDIFEEEEYLLYSPGVAEEIRKTRVVLFFSLNFDNGLCRQTYGPLVSIRGLDYEDIVYLNSRLYPGLDLVEWENPMPLVEKNPVPYMLLMSVSQIPVVYHNKDQMVLCFSEYDDDSFYTDGLEEHFRIKYSNGLYKLELKRWSEFPHFATAYYDESGQTLHLMAMTERGFEKLVERLEDCGYELEPEPEPDTRLNAAMLAFIEKMFKKPISLFGYERNFMEKTYEQDQASSQVNMALQRLVPYINEGETPDFDEIASETGTNPDQLREIYRNLMQKINR